jgi:hypothetical protein
LSQPVEGVLVLSLILIVFLTSGGTWHGWFLP